MTPQRALGAILVLAFLVRVANVWLTSRLPLADYQFHWANSDMGFVWMWAGRVVGGDVLGREGPHHFASWMVDIAPRATWERWWGGAAVFEKAPLYTYALAALRLAGGEGYWSVALVQLILGLLNVALVFALAGRYFGRGAAIAAGLGAATYGPFLLHETLVLRDTLAVTCVLVCLWTLTRAADAKPRWWFGAGLLFAIAVLIRETTLAFGPLVIVWIVQRQRRTPAACVAACLAFLAGAGLGFTPLVARNVAVGVAPWAVSARGLEGFVYGNAAGGSIVGILPPPSARAILESADGHLGRAISLTLATWQGDWRGLVAHELAKFSAIFSAYEPADNVNWYYFAERLPTLRWSLGFPAVLGLGLLGFFAPGKRADSRILAYFLLSALVGFMYASVVGRYRLVPAAVLLVCAGGAIAWFAQLARSRNWTRAAVLAVAAVAVMVVSVSVLPDSGPRDRSAEFLMAAKELYRRGHRDASRAELEQGLATAARWPREGRLPPLYFTLLQTLVSIHVEQGEPARAAAMLERFAADYPDDADVRALLGVVYYDALRRPEQGAAHLAESQRLRASQAGAAASGARP